MTLRARIMFVAIWIVSIVSVGVLAQL